MSALLGTLLNDRYRLDARIGAGGMSTVYRAFDQTLERQVAIKLMNREIAEDSDQLERFRREARAVAQLSHPYIVGVIDAGEDHHRPYIVFEYVEGETLKDRIRRSDGGLPVAEAVAYSIEIARALGAAHARNIVHRDVKPQNVLIDEEGSAKVTDFGIARTLDEEGLTADGRVLGTTDYVSPEQALGRPVTGQSDLYSLGVVLYEMLTGDVPFKGENQVAVAMKHVREQIPDVQLLRPEVSATLASIVDRATAKDLNVRYATDAELIADLEDVLALETARSGVATGEATTVLRTVSGRARRRLPFRVRYPGWGGALALLMLIGVIVLVIVLSQRTHRGTGGVPGEKPPKGVSHSISLHADAAKDYDPLGDQQEHSPAVGAVLDRDPGSTWTTENYNDAALPKAGVGIYLDAAPSVSAKLLEVRTSTPHFQATVYGAKTGPPTTLPDAGWVKLGAASDVGRKERISLTTGSDRYRYYLLWITKLPPQGTKVEISELSLFR